MLLDNIRLCRALIVAVVAISSPLLCILTDANAQIVREERHVDVNGAMEAWRLVWLDEPSPVCSFDDLDGAITCPCRGLAYGERGELVLVRERAGAEVERLQLEFLFGNDPGFPQQDNKKYAYLQRWPEAEGDFERAFKANLGLNATRADEGLTAEITNRSATSIMNFADYNHDGVAAEFLIQVATLPCGKLQFAAVGVSTDKHRLHAFSSVAKPDTPLVMPLHAWQELLKTDTPSEIVVWPCDDHGSEVATALSVSAIHGRITLKRRVYSCPSQGADGKLLTEDDG